MKNFRRFLMGPAILFSIENSIDTKLNCIQNTQYNREIS